MTRSPREESANLQSSFHIRAGCVVLITSGLTVFLITTLLCIHPPKNPYMHALISE